MKRFFALLSALLMLCGCASAVPEETEGPLPANIQIAPLEGERSFSGFTVRSPGEGAAEVRAMVEAALGEYPSGLLAQLGSVEILLAEALNGEGQFAGGSYAGFTQQTGDGWRMVLDITACHTGTIHHELAHIIDGILTAAQRLPEADWMELNPPGFQYGTGDWEAYSDFFAEAYSMENILEDRASVFEAAVMGGIGTFDGKSPLWLKLHTFAQAIRAHFDTQGWPAAAIWELALRGKM